jgi:hypothetical protein
VGLGFGTGRALTRFPRLGRCQTTATRGAGTGLRSKGKGQGWEGPGRFDSTQPCLHRRPRVFVGVCGRYVTRTCGSLLRGVLVGSVAGTRMHQHALVCVRARVCARVCGASP